MLRQLTRCAVLVWLFAEATLGQSPPPPEKARQQSLPRRATSHSVQWVHVPLGQAIERLRSAAGVEMFLDRRVDPNLPINLSLSDASSEEIVARLAIACELGFARCEQLFYLGPPQTAARLKALATMRRKDVSRLPTKERQSLLKRQRIVWPRLTEPRDLVVRLMEEHGWRVEHGERIPHDLWPAGQLPQLALADQLTLLLAGFDRSYRIVPERHAIEIVPVDWNRIQPAAKEITSPKRPATTGGRRVFTLRVENQPVGQVLDQLGRRLGWQLAVDEAALRAAGHSLDQRVSFKLENANEDQLLDALLAPAGLKAERDGKNVRVAPR